MFATRKRLSSAVEPRRADLAPAAERAVGAGHRPGRRRRRDEGLEPRPHPPGIGRDVGEADRRPRAVAELDMGVLGRDPLHLGQQVGVERELQHVLRVRLALQLGVGDLVGPGPERRRPLDPLEEVAPAAPGAAGERALEHHLGAPLERRAGRRDALRQRHALPDDLDDAPARGPQPRQVARLVGVAVALQELRVLAVLARRGPPSHHPRQVERRRVGASGKAHQVGSGEKDTTLVTLHLSASPSAPPPLAGAPTCGASRPRLPYWLSSVTKPVIVHRASRDTSTQPSGDEVVNRHEHCLENPWR